MAATRLHQLAKSPQAFDTQLAALYLELAKAQRNRQVTEDNVHKVAGDRKGYEGKRLVWGRTYAEVATTAKAEGYEDVLSAVAKAIQEVAKIQVRIQDMDEVYQAHRWLRYILCLSNNGHVHNEVGCSTLYFDTPVEWRPDLSGLDFDGAVAILGPVLCSVCYPSAPVEHKRSNLTEQARQRTQGERDAAKIERAAKLAAKNLTDAETEFMGRVGVFNERATTVAKLKEIIRKAVEQAVEVEFWATHTPEGWDAEHLANRRRNGADGMVKLEADADRAQFILIERERAQEGHGATAEEIAKIRASKLKNARKEWGL
jgi:hypothetical protein